MQLLVPPVLRPLQVPPAHIRPQLAPGPAHCAGRAPPTPSSAALKPAHASSVPRARSAQQGGTPVTPAPAGLSRIWQGSPLARWEGLRARSTWRGYVSGEVQRALQVHQPWLDSLGMRQPSLPRSLPRCSPALLARTAQLALSAHSPAPLDSLRWRSRALAWRAEQGPPAWGALQTATSPAQTVSWSVHACCMHCAVPSTRWLPALRYAPTVTATCISLTYASPAPCTAGSTCAASKATTAAAVQWNCPAGGYAVRDTRTKKASCVRCPANVRAL